MNEIACKICALHLIQRCYRRHWWFRLVREPLVYGMRLLAWRNGIDASKYVVQRQECRGCVRFMKAELEEKSGTFRFLNRLVGGRFKRLRDSMLEKAEFVEAKRIAAEAMPQPPNGKARP